MYIVGHHPQLCLEIAHVLLLTKQCEETGYGVHEHRFSSYLPIFLFCCFVFKEGFAMLPKLALHSLFLSQLQDYSCISPSLGAPQCHGLLCGQ